ncbi:ferritin-like domain-containing protein [Pseudoxanthomonas composti]|uniref:Ferritin-like domain-containing protein n=1 Tax=Pseudoxanthomonas composti TaxID=2137479 RepID=A0A4Q1JRP3_9GAMM|nr:ferritin-like domain-containing protein [Pseudoxanthomonas composti]RXR00865.1 ferritin-like domain-containing protein [Pseudoxanthomonas composti]
MATEQIENLKDWLRDAHAMEQQAESMLKAQAARLEHYPRLKARIEEHLQETQAQKALLEGCFERLDISPSTIKDALGKVAAIGQALGGSVNSDEVVKGVIASYVFENLEIASYTSLKAAAQAVGDSAVAQVCDQILPQEQAMADWLRQYIPEVTEEFLARDATPGVTAKK